MPSKEVEEALKELTQMMSLEENLSQAIRDRDKYGENFIPLIRIEDPNGLLSDDKQPQNR